VVRADAGGTMGSAELDCAGADRAACRRVAEVLPALAPDPDEACAELYGGPERIRVRGRLDGREVDVEATRVDGCAIRRYDLLAAALEG
jgi:hypothetical protein